MAHKFADRAQILMSVMEADQCHRSDEHCTHEKAINLVRELVEFVNLHVARTD